MQLCASIFKAYDVRGVVPVAINEEVAYALGCAFGSLALKEGQSTVAIGRDGRLSGAALSAALASGLAAVGIQVLDCGLVTTPMLYFAACTLCTSGIQVTGSHNPKDYNGFKLVLAGRAIYGEEIQTLRHIMQQQSWQPQSGGLVRQIDVAANYAARITGDIHLARRMHIIVDSGNGVAGAFAPALLRAIGCQVDELHSVVDGNFPNHHPDPSRPKNLQDLIAALKDSEAEIGLAFDGDGDRLGLVAKDGSIIYPDRQMMLFARDVLQRNTGAKIVFDVKCSQQLAAVISAAGGVPEMFSTGHSLIKARMKQINAPLGGEMSGHIFFKERWYGFDDASYGACRLLEILSQTPNANATLAALPSSFATPELNITCEPGQAQLVVDELLQRASAHFAAPAKLCLIDGLRVDWPDGFGLIRASNTTPLLVLRFEGHSQAALARIQMDMLALLHSVLPNAQLDTAAH